MLYENQNDKKMIYFSKEISCELFPVVQSENGVAFRTKCSTAESVTLHLFQKEGEFYYALPCQKRKGFCSYPMNSIGEGIWLVEINRELSGLYYAYEIEFQGKSHFSTIFSYDERGLLK